MKFPWPIRYTIPLALLVYGGLVCWFIFQTAITSDNLRLEEDYLGRANRLTLQMRSMAEHFYNEESPSSNDLTIRLAGLSPNLKEAFLVDHTGTVRFSLNPEWMNKPISLLPPEFRPPNDLSTASADNGIAFVSSDRSKVISIQAFDFPLQAGFELKPGFVIIQFDIKASKEKIVLGIKQGMFLVLSALFVLCFGVWLAFYLTITARALKMVRSARALAEGDYTARSALRGSDELAVLSRALDAMAGTIEHRTNVLERMNGHLLVEINERRRVEESLKSTEQRFLSVWKNSAEGMRLTDSEGVIVAVNEAYCRLVGLSESELVGKPFTAVYAPTENIVEMRERYKDRYVNRKVVTHVERRMSFVTDQHMDLEITNSWIELEQGSPLLLGIFRDVTRRKQAERGLLKVMDSQKLESLGVLAGGIAHDFNNLLTAILGNTSLGLLKLPPDSPVRNYLQNVEKTSLQAAELCKQMLAYSGRGRFVIEQADLNTLIREMVHLLQVSIPKKCQLILDLAEELPLVEVDASQIRQVVMNLVINAAEAIEDKNGTITVRSGCMSPPNSEWMSGQFLIDLPHGTYVYIEVVDTGSGMSQETKAKIFDPFFTTKFTGRGLGLAAVLGIVRGHKGGLKVYSELGHGTTFKILLPSIASESVPSKDNTSEDSDWKGSGAVLFIDDEESIRLVAAQLLETLGFTALTASNGHEGVKTFKDKQDEIVLVMMDMTMPGLNGEEAFCEMKKICPDVRVILVSGYSEQDAIGRFHEKGLSGFLNKPFSVAELRTKLQLSLNSANTMVSAIE